VLGGRVRNRVRPRSMSRYGTVVDDSSSLRILLLELPDSFSRAKESSNDVNIDDRLESCERQVLNRHSDGGSSGVLLSLVQGQRGCRYLTAKNYIK